MKNITKKDFFTAMALTGILANGFNYDLYPEDLIEDATKIGNNLWLKTLEDEE